MIGNEPPNRLPVDAAFQGAPVALDAAFDARWTAWVARGRIHEQRVRQKFVIWAGVLAIGAAIAYALLRP